MRPRTPAQRFTPYAVQFRQVCGAIAAYAPGDETRKLHAVSRSLERSHACRGDPDGRQARTDRP